MVGYERHHHHLLLEAGGVAIDGNVACFQSPSSFRGYGSLPGQQLASNLGRPAEEHEKEGMTPCYGMQGGVKVGRKESPVHHHR